MKVFAQVVWADAVVPVQGAIVVVTVGSIWVSTVCDTSNIWNCMSLSTRNETSLKNANCASPPVLVPRLGALERLRRVCTAAPHCSADRRQRRLVMTGSGVQAVPPSVMVEPPVPVVDDEPPFPVPEDPPLPVADEPPFPVLDEPPPPLPVFTDPVVVLM